MTDYSRLPPGLTAPEDDGACAHLTGLAVPGVVLPSTAGRGVDLAAGPGRVVAFCYPMTGRPGEPLPDDWDAIPGARGCTPQACGFRDLAREYAALGVTLYGVSSQSPADQSEAAARLHLPFELLSDERLEFAAELRLPLFEAGGRWRIRRLTLVVAGGRVEHAFYPVFPPDTHATQVLAWLAASRAPNLG